MPHHTSPKKALRRDEKARMRNKSQMSTMKTYRKKAKLQIVSNSIDEQVFSHTQSLIARAGRKGLIPKGRASRMISRLMKAKVTQQTLQTPAV